MSDQSSTDEFIIAVRCPHCHAAAGEPCIVKTSRGKFHAPRIDRGLRNYNADLVKRANEEWDKPEERT